jgi:hypothetical protein
VKYAEAICEASKIHKEVNISPSTFGDILRKDQLEFAGMLKHPYGTALNVALCENIFIM